MSSGSEILKRAETEIRRIFKEQVDSGYTYHNINHTMKVYEAVIDLGKESSLSEDEIEDLSQTPGDMPQASGESMIQKINAAIQAG